MKGGGAVVVEGAGCSRRLGAITHSDRVLLFVTKEPLDPSLGCADDTSRSSGHVTWLFSRCQCFVLEQRRVHYNVGGAGKSNGLQYRERERATRDLIRSPREYYYAMEARRQETHRAEGFGQPAHANSHQSAMAKRPQWTKVRSDAGAVLGESTRSKTSRRRRAEAGPARESEPASPI